MLNIQNVKVKVEQGFEKICPFPVGYVYQSMEDTSPAEVFGGTWTKVDDGRYLRAASDSKTGGSDTISVSQMPSHTHHIDSNLPFGVVACDKFDNSTSGIPARQGGSSQNIWCHEVYLNFDCTTAGGGQPFYPTYQNVYAWYRVS